MNCEGIGWQAKAPAPPRLTKVLHHSPTLAACDDLVGRTPWSAVDPLVDLLERRKSRTKGSGADGGVRPTFGCGYAALWDRRFRLSSCEWLERLIHESL